MEYSTPLRCGQQVPSAEGRVQKTKADHVPGHYFWT